MTVQDGVTQPFAVGRVLAQSVSIAVRNIVPFGLLSLLIMSPPYLYALAIDAELYSDVWDTSATTELWTGSFIVTMIIEGLLVLLLQAALTYGIVQELRGQHTGIGDSIGIGLSQILPVIGVAILIWLATSIGYALFVVPGIIFTVMLWVAIPVAVIERPGVVASLDRSTKLTKGYRWPILGLIILIFVVASIGYFAVTSIVYMLIFNVPVLILSELVGTAVFNLIFATVNGVTYYHLRVAKEGVDIEQIAAVFD